MSQVTPSPPPSPPLIHTQIEIKKIMSTIFEVVGQSGSRYVIQQALQKKECPTRRVYLASAGKDMFIVKDVHQCNFEYLLAIYRRVGSCPYIRLLHDTVLEQSMFVYKYFTGHLLSLAKKDLPIALTKRILKDTLRGLAALHDQNIVHNDVKANNIVIDWEEVCNGIKITKVQLTDLEDAAHLNPEFNICGLQVGNYMWRSPEALASARVNKPSDMFSFGVFCVFAVTKRVIFAVDKDELEEGVEVLAIVLERQVSYFSDDDGFNGLMKHLGDSPWCEIFRVIRDGVSETQPRRPVSKWEGDDIDADFRDLINGLTNFDPAKRITAHEALAHRWFADVGTDE